MNKIVDVDEAIKKPHFYEERYIEQIKEKMQEIFYNLKEFREEYNQITQLKSFKTLCKNSLSIKIVIMEIWCLIKCNQDLYNKFII